MKKNPRKAVFYAVVYWTKCCPADREVFQTYGQARGWAKGLKRGYAYHVLREEHLLMFKSAVAP